MISSFSWLIFVNRPAHLPIDDIAFFAPYDCDFIITRPHNSTSYELSRLYNLRERRVFTNFGIWNVDFGLKTFKSSKYFEKMDMNQTEYKSFTQVCNPAVSLVSWNRAWRIWNKNNKCNAFSESLGGPNNVINGLQ